MSGDNHGEISIEKVLLNPRPDAKATPQGETISDLKIDGYIKLSGESGTDWVYLFRRAANGGRDIREDVAVLLWCNPDEPLDSITLRPKLIVESREVKIKNGMAIIVQ